MLHGRAVECAVVDRLLRGARSSHSGVVVIRGEPGVGKSALLDYAGERWRGLRCLRAVGVESEVQLPFAALHQLLFPVLEHVDGLPAPQAAALRGALGLGEGRGEDRFLVAVAVLSLLGEVAGDGGLLCLVDDAQWLDQPSADALVFAARRLEAEGVALLLAAREGEARHFAAPGLAELLLSGLDAIPAAELLAQRCPTVAPGVRKQLAERTAGNPLALLELPSVLRADQLTGREPLPDPLPLGGRVERVFAEQVGRLPEPSQRLLLLAAAADTGELSTIVRAAPAIGSPVEALGAAETSGLVRMTDGRLEFRHPLVRSAVYQRATLANRQAAHLALARALGGDDDADRRAWHLAAAALEPDDNIAAALERSADRARMRSGGAASVAALERAAALSEDVSERGRRLLAAAEAAWLAGQPARTATLLDQGEPMLMNPAVRGRMLRLRGLTELRSGVPDKAYRLLLRSACELAAHDPHGAVTALVLATEAASLTAVPEQARELRRLARGMPAGDEPIDRLMRTCMADWAGVLLSDWGPGTGAGLRAMVEHAPRLRDPQHLTWAGRAALYLGDHGVAQALYARAVEEARAAGAVGQLAPMLERLVTCDFLTGHFTEAVAVGGEALRLAGQVGQGQGVAFNSLALVAAARGDEEACRSYAGEALALADAHRSRLIGAGAAWALGLLELGLGRPAAALDRLRLLAEIGGRSNYPPLRLLATPDLVEAAVRAGRPDTCLVALDGFERWAAWTGQPGALARASHSRGLLAEGDVALGHLAEAVAQHANAPQPFTQARTQLVYGEALRRAKRRSQARSHLRQALEAFDALGATPWAERARTELRATGETARKRDPGTLDRLTPQELQIARYASQGASNPEIAERLFLSRRTIEYHLHKVFTKVGIASRMELVGLNLDTPAMSH